MAGAAQAELAQQGFSGISPANEFAMRAIAAGAGSASELGRRLSVSKQAAAKTIATLEQQGYVGRADDPADARRKLVTVTPRGQAAMQAGEAIMDALRAQWADRIGSDALARLEDNLTALVGPSPIDLAAPGQPDGDEG